MPTFGGSNPNDLRVAPRLSTPEPFGVPRWEDAPADMFDFGALLQEYTPASMSQPTQQPVQTGSLALSLPGLGLGLAGVNQWAEAYQKQPEYTPSNAAELLGKMATTPQGSGGGKKSGGLGLSAYGWNGPSGGKGTKGSSPFGFQDQMWGALGAANAAMKAAGLGTFGITDGWRSYDQQVALKKKKPKLAATAGRSVHGLGLAADLRLSNAQYKWLLANGKKYGLVNLPSESWHWQLDPSAWGGWG